MGNDGVKRYTGDFQYKGQKVPGEITYNKEKGIIDLKLTQHFESEEEYREVSWNERLHKEANRIRTDRVASIIGWLHTDHKVTLRNCRLLKDDSDGITRILKFRADYVIFDELLDTAPKYNRFTFVVENGLQWSGHDPDCKAAG